MSDKQIMDVIRKVLEKGNDVEIKKSRDGKLLISEIKKHRVVSWNGMIEELMELISYRNVGCWLFFCFSEIYKTYHWQFKKYYVIIYLTIKLNVKYKRR